MSLYEEVPKGSATSTPLPARLILVTKPNVHGGPARKKARVVICEIFKKCTQMNSRPPKLQATQH